MDIMSKGGVEVYFLITIRIIAHFYIFFFSKQRSIYINRDDLIDMFINEIFHEFDDIDDDLYRSINRNENVENIGATNIYNKYDENVFSIHEIQEKMTMMQVLGKIVLICTWKINILIWSIRITN